VAGGLLLWLAFVVIYDNGTSSHMAWLQTLATHQAWSHMHRGLDENGGVEQTSRQLVAKLSLDTEEDLQ
jgi:hypothetical protein